MAIKITDDCINCAACEPECPNGAIYEAGAEWRMSDKTGLSGDVKLSDGRTIDADEAQPARSHDYYFVVSDKCTECEGFHDEPQCASVCPVDCCVKDEAHPEGQEQLLARKEFLHP
jgi:ferredoxin